MNDPVADMLIRIKNAYLSRRQTVVVPTSKFKKALAQILMKYHYIGEVSNEDADTMSIKLIYNQGEPVLTDVKRVSKPGLRRYVGVDKLAQLRPGLGFLIISTPKGLLTHVEAKKERVGGEIICKIW